MENELNLGNICGGAALEVFERELKTVLRDIKDPNTDAEAARKLALSFTFKPMKDRSGALVTFKCTTGLAGVEAVEGHIFISAQKGEVRGFAHDPRQDALQFAQPEGGKQ